ncbi:unnamed protein product [Meganyctiphanes norvegica]|uniref:Uncharacterized protein n=1 Tax=Meganyctiphanes norvegica TaxID=48144 RepID=A0AAV2QUD1_MEGNR
MDNHSKLLKNHLLELLNPVTTPEKALQSLSSCLSPTTYTSSDDEPVVIFLAYMRFLIARLPGASVDGIWEHILRKTINYSRNFTITEKLALDDFVREEFTLCSPKLCIKLIPIETYQVFPWLYKALGNHQRCPNPYIRLELFRLIRLFSDDDLGDMAIEERLSITFMQTICEIQPHHLYPSGNEDDLVFSVFDFDCIINACSRDGKLQQMISSDLIKQLSKSNNVIINSYETKFLTQCLQIIGIYAVITGSRSNPTNQNREIQLCFKLLRHSIGLLVNCRHHLPCMSDWKQFCYIFAHPPFNRYAVEAVHDITVAITNNKDSNKVDQMLQLRDIIAKALNVCTKTFNLPKLLTSRQVDGLSFIHRQSFVLSGLALNRDNSIKTRKDPYSEYGYYIWH